MSLRTYHLSDRQHRQHCLLVKLDMREQDQSCPMSGNLYPYHSWETYGFYNLTVVTANATHPATSDIRGRGSAYFTLLSDLCTLSKTTFNNAVQQFLEEVLVSAQVKPQPEFLSQMEIIVEQFEKTTPYRFSCVLQLIRDITHGNTLVSAYSLDWNWWVTNNVTNSTVPMRAAASTELYSYGKRSDCINSGDIYLAFTQQSRLGIPGFHVGCSAVEALLRSTFECLYNQTCVDALQKFSVDNVNYFNASAYVVAMNPTLSSRFSLNNTIVNIVNTRFIEQWNVNISHFEIL
ncbi:unnamed protein product [Rotaria magnacalcarata]|uniref:Uncharacterized protein n=1 Tax=Rotaria magnacalcarata TaxID=392030 RepID=A0A8S2JJD3_9BILA|nr:unnamed protein product [Rotaria magnacalcarata]CAF3822195.1 unnamed protein product [Rotaria magnacalcarata]